MPICATNGVKLMIMIAGPEVGGENHRAADRQPRILRGDGDRHCASVAVTSAPM